MMIISIHRYQLSVLGACSMKKKLYRGHPSAVSRKVVIIVVRGRLSPQSCGEKYSNTNELAERLRLPHAIIRGTYRGNTHSTFGPTGPYRPNTRWEKKNKGSTHFRESPAELWATTHPATLAATLGR